MHKPFQSLTKRMVLVSITCLCFIYNYAQSFSATEIKNWKAQTDRITIIRDNWGVPHVYAKTDADAVFGMMYVQCESYFKNVESNIISRLGREAEISGKKSLYKDLFARMYIDTIKAKGFYNQCTPYMQKLCDAYAAGINFYIYMHPNEKPQLLNRIQPWVPLLNNIPGMENLNLSEADVRAMYPLPINASIAYEPLKIQEENQAGSNGWAIDGKHTFNKAPILLINPHSEFYNRIEIQLVSEEGLNVYGAPFLGEFHIWQGFNEFCGWMHTVTLSDAKDLYAEQVELRDHKRMYAYDNQWKAVDSSKIELSYKEGEKLEKVNFTIYRTHHGPVVGKKNNQWISAKTMNENVELLSVHWNITKSKTNKEFVYWLNKRVMTGTNTIYADQAGNIGYWHGNFVPLRDTSYDWTRVVPGNTSKTEWQRAHTLNELPHYFNPINGWVQNCNSSPIYGAGNFDTLISKKPSYMHPDGHTPRAMNAVRLLKQIKKVNIDSVINLANDNYLMSGQRFIPALIKAYQNCTTDSILAQLKQPIDVLKKWNYRTDTNSIATTLTVLWVERLIFLNIEKLKKPFTIENQYGVANGSTISTDSIPNQKLLTTMILVLNDLKKDWGTWEVTWGSINRYQRNTAKKDPSDNLFSYAVPATPGFMGSTNAFVSKKGKDTKKRYGVSGNTFVAAVSFGNKLEAKSILTGGSSSNENSKHFTDQAKGYINHEYKTVHFYKSDVLKNKELSYHPGAEPEIKEVKTH